jgi:hypothetical protein
MRPPLLSVLLACASLANAQWDDAPPVTSFLKTKGAHHTDHPRCHSGPPNENARLDTIRYQGNAEKFSLSDYSEGKAALRSGDGPAVEQGAFVVARGRPLRTTHMGPCTGLALIDPENGAVALAHLDAGINVRTQMPRLLAEFEAAGGRPNRALAVLAKLAIIPGEEDLGLRRVILTYLQKTFPSRTFFWDQIGVDGQYIDLAVDPSRRAVGIFRYTANCPRNAGIDGLTNQSIYGY